ncbi:unnamed protein product [Porites evermanni]|uniref:F-box domain-containing protein n=1 Tax=Porites evermanni TaxID=104178 RepID=A0ABN8M1V1_9CNID|nr:unnamed protein product [Porites evermanni]
MSALHLSPKTPKSFPSRQCSLTKEHDVLKENGLFDSLPSELIQYIFSFLELIDLIRAAGTCRLFFQHCYDQVWYKELDLKPYWSLITSEVLDSLHTRCSSTEKLDLSWSGPYEAISSDSIIRFLQHCGSNLVCLRLSCCQYVDNDVIKHLGQYCPNLEELDLQSCNSNSLTREGLLRLQDLKKLQRINLYRVKVQDDVVEQLIHSAKNLRHLNLGGCDVVMECDLLMQSLSVHCRGLVSLDLWRNKGLTGKGVRCLADGCSLLEELDIGWCTNVTSAPECVVYLTSKCKKLRKLFLTALRSVNDDIINALANNCPDIEQVDVLGTGLIHAESIMRLLRQCKHLKLLDVSFCSQLTVEIVEGLQEMYPAVSIKKSFIVEESAT